MIPQKDLDNFCGLMSESLRSLTERIKELFLVSLEGLRIFRLFKFFKVSSIGLELECELLSVLLRLLTRLDF